MDGNFYKAVPSCKTHWGRRFGPSHIRSAGLTRFRRGKCKWRRKPVMMIARS